MISFSLNFGRAFANFKKYAYTRIVVGGARENRPRDRAVACLTDHSRWTRVSLTGSRRDQEEGGGAGPSTHRVPGEIKRREVVLGPQVSPEEVMSREVEIGL